MGKAQSAHSEDKRTRFRRVVTKRMNKALDLLRLVGKCANQAVYSYTDQEVQQVMQALEKGVRAVRMQFQSRGAGRDGRFSLGEQRPYIKDGRLMLPDGTALESKLYDGAQFPSIDIYRIGLDGVAEKICFAEYNAEKPPGQELCIGAYRSDEPDTVYYESYIRGMDQGGEEHDGEN